MRTILVAITHLFTIHTLIRVPAPCPATGALPIPASKRRLIASIRTVKILVTEVGLLDTVARLAREFARRTRSIQTVNLVGCSLILAVVAAIADLIVR